MAVTAEIAERRQKVAELWLVGTSTLAIAKQLKMSERAIRRDIATIRQQLDKDRLQEIEERRTRSLAVLRRTQQAAWVTYSKVLPNSVNCIGALNVVHACEQTICKLEGTIGADLKIEQTTNVTTMTSEEWQRIQQVIAQALMPFHDARIAVASALAQMETPV